MRLLAIAVLAVACSAPRVSVDGPWEMGFYAADAGPDAAPLDCFINGRPAGKFSGVWALHEKDGKLSGQWDLCGSNAAGADLAGSIDEAGAFDLNIAGGAVGIVEGSDVLEQLGGIVTGLGGDFLVRGKRPGAGHGKTLPPPPDGLP